MFDITMKDFCILKKKWANLETITKKVHSYESEGRLRINMFLGFFKGFKN
jgi:hypothetical protein